VYTKEEREAAVGDVEKSDPTEAVRRRGVPNSALCKRAKAPAGEARAGGLRVLLG
jgi:hypothetical protein